MIWNIPKLLHRIKSKRSSLIYNEVGNKPKIKPPCQVRLVQISGTQGNTLDKKRLHKKVVKIRVRFKSRAFFVLFYAIVLLWKKSVALNLRRSKIQHHSVNFINILRTNFSFKCHFSSFFYVTREKAAELQLNFFLVRRTLTK